MSDSRPTAVSVAWLKKLLNVTPFTLTVVPAGPKWYARSNVPARLTSVSPLIGWIPPQVIVLAAVLLLAKPPIASNIHTAVIPRRVFIFWRLVNAHVMAGFLVATVRLTILPRTPATP